MSAFARYIGIDYSGAETPTASLRGLRVYMAEGDTPPAEVPPPPSPGVYWTRRETLPFLVIVRRGCCAAKLRESYRGPYRTRETKLMAVGVVQVEETHTIQRRVVK